MTFTPTRPLPAFSAAELKRFHTEPAPNVRAAGWGGIKPPAMDGRHQTCLECGAKVLLPCLACQLRSQGFVKEPTDD